MGDTIPNIFPVCAHMHVSVHLSVCVTGVGMGDGMRGRERVESDQRKRKNQTKGYLEQKNSILKSASMQKHELYEFKCK